ncbi:hypothetical protein K470DRAFT_248965, partial [Piedraia hortae CBS 480.64]
MLVEFPLIEAYNFVRPSDADVLVVRNVPLDAMKQDVLKLFDNMPYQIVEQPIGTGYRAIHLVPCHRSGTKLSAYVEFRTPCAARAITKHFINRAKATSSGAGGGYYIGGNRVRVYVTTQSELMAALFPWARGVLWVGSIPHISPKQWNTPTGFRGFMHEAETNAMSRAYHLRSLEHCISIIHKYPWGAAEHIFLLERDALFTTAKLILSLGINSLVAEPSSMPKSSRTRRVVQELAIAIFTCPGFNEAQKSA